MKQRLLAGVGVAVAALGFALPTSAAVPDSRLLATYEPLVQFDPAESFFPSHVQAFIADSTLERFNGTSWDVVDADPGPGNLPAGGPAWRLNQQPCSPAAALGGLTCYAAAANEDGGGPVVYGRVATAGDETVLQYWYFYYSDVYSYPFAPAGLLWQAHEGDWEVVNVVLSSDGEPLYTGYSQHCLGQRRDWSSVERVDGTHPVVHVALGSHANYYSTGLHPFNLACVPPPAIALLQRLGLPMPADVVGAGSTLGPPSSDGRALPVHNLANGDAAWLDFGGQWGELQYFHAPAPVGTVALGTAPVGPAYHEVWSDPLGTLASWPMG
jgi:hypothetical protein